MKETVKQLTSAKRTTAATIAVILIVIIGGTWALHYHPAKRTGSTDGGTQRAASKTTDNGAAVSSSTGGPPPGTTDADKQAAAHANARPITDACTLLTQTVAVQLLGAGAKTTAPGDTGALQATNTTLTACAYAAGTNNVQLVIRKPAGLLGASENATMFGSGKPSGAVSVAGYGQTAYWDTAKHALNVLGDNNWYIITRGPSGTQTAAETVAKLLAPGF